MTLMSKLVMAYAHHARPTMAVVTIDWTAWDSVGAAARNIDMVAATGVSFISPSEGSYWFVNELLLGHEEREVAILSESMFHRWPFLGSDAEGPGERRVVDDRGRLLVSCDYPLIDGVRVSSSERVEATRTFLNRSRQFLASASAVLSTIVACTFGVELLAEAGHLLRPDLTVLWVEDDVGRRSSCSGVGRVQVSLCASARARG